MLTPKGGYTTVAGLEPARALPNGFQVHLNSHYEKLPLLNPTWDLNPEPQDSFIKGRIRSLALYPIEPVGQISRLTDLNRRPKELQSSALPTELSRD